MTTNLAPALPINAPQHVAGGATRQVVAVVQPARTTGPNLARTVRAGGFEAVVVRDAERVRTLLRRRRVEAVVAEVDTVGPIGALASAAKPSGLPVLVVTDPGRVHPGEALDAGADDVATIPLDHDELLARLRAALRRAHPAGEPPAVVTTPDFTIDLTNRRCQGVRGDIHLTGIEWQLVEALCRHPGHLVAAQRLRESIWGPGQPARGAWLRVHMCSLRKKLEPNRARPRYFQTEPGLGVRFVPESRGDA